MLAANTHGVGALQVGVFLDELALLIAVGLAGELSEQASAT